MCPLFVLFHHLFKPLPAEGQLGCLRVFIIIKISAVTILAHLAGVFGWFFCEADRNALTGAKVAVPLKTPSLQGPSEARGWARPPHSCARTGPRGPPCLAQAVSLFSTFLLQLPTPGVL